MPSIIIKTADELARQRHAGQLLASVFDMLDTFIVPGVTTMEINDRVEDFIVNQLDARPASKGQYDFPYVLNTSINDVVCHGIPKATEHLRSGMIVNVDITLEKAGMIADSSKMYLIGDVSRWRVPPFVSALYPLASIAPRVLHTAPGVSALLLIKLIIKR